MNGGWGRLKMTAGLNPVNMQSASECEQGNA